MSMKKIGWLTLLLAGTAACNAPRSGDERIERLLARMTLEQKVGQMAQVAGEPGGFRFAIGASSSDIRTARPFTVK